MTRLEFDSVAIMSSLVRASDLLDDATPIYEDIVEHLIGSTRSRFQLGQAPDGSRWRDKSTATLAAYVRRGHGSRPRPLIGPSEDLSERITGFSTSRSAEIGSPLIYSGVMQDGARKGAFGTTSRGSPIPWGDIPARVWLGPSESDERAILDIVDEHIAAVLGE